VSVEFFEKEFLQRMSPVGVVVSGFSEYHHAKGLPRVINTLCYDCLCEIYELQKGVVDLPTLERVLCRYNEG
jgi:hypothetical protein